VTVKGSAFPIGFYTVNVDTHHLGVEEPYNVSKEDLEMVHKARKTYIRQHMIEGKLNASDLFVKDDNIRLLCVKTTDEFDKTWEEALKLYLAGKW